MCVPGPAGTLKSNLGNRERRAGPAKQSNTREWLGDLHVSSIHVGRHPEGVALDAHLAGLHWWERGDNQVRRAAGGT